MKQPKLNLRAAALIAYLLPGLTVLSPAFAEPELPQLKLGVPKLDQSLRKAVPLKGSVQHNQQLPTKLKAPQNGSAATNQSGGLAGKAQADNSALLKAKAKQDRTSLLNAEAQSGIGIIGVKFIMAFGRPPVINRVFPGTPASDKGLREHDVIVAVDGIPTFGLSKDEVYNMIVGTPHTPVTISVRRKADFQVRTMERMDFNDITDPQVRRDYQSM